VGAGDAEEKMERRERVAAMGWFGWKRVTLRKKN